MLGIAIVLSTVLVNSRASLSAEIIYDDNYLYRTFDDNPGEIQIFPNPVINNILNISAENSIVEIEILDITGSTVFMQKYEKETKKVVLSLVNLNRGLYIIQVMLDNNSSRTEKIIIE
jgi:hypothetical protein